jgi:thiosulfate/3-mercaptopyruvate sulfurtransferase
MDILVSTDWLAEHLNDAHVRICDVRWYLLEKDRTGYEEYLRGHIPNAVFIDLETDLAAHFTDGGGRHPLPRADHFAEAMTRAGIDANTYVVAYDDRGGAAAARLWWLLRYFGHPRAALLDGGIAQWIAEGRPLSRDIPRVMPGKFAPQPHPEMIADLNTVKEWHHDPRTLILDVRIPERYRGEIEPLDPRAGHIPGARNAPIAGNLRSATDLRFLTPAELRARYDSLGATRAERVVAYCGSGVNACQAIFALTLAGFDHARLYPGSWSEWSRAPDLPVATGA